MHSGCQSSLPIEIPVEEAWRRVSRADGAEPAILIDVREPDEHAIARLAGAELIPMGTIPERLGYLEGLSDSGSLIILCHHGVRSLHTAAWLREHGIDNAQSMQGGIDAWSRLIDPAIPRY